MPTPKVIFKVDVDEIAAVDASLDARRRVEASLRESVELANRMCHNAYRAIARIDRYTRKRRIKKEWNDLPEAVAYFGTSKVNKRQVGLVRKRLKRVRNRLRDKRLKIRLLPQARASSESVNGSNHGILLSPLKFTLYPNWFEHSEAHKAAIIIHELFHDRFLDHKVRHDGERVTAYGSDLAKKLARKRPIAARRNPENYEQFCEELWLREGH